MAAVLETSNPDKETLLRLISRMVEESREIYGSAVAFEPDAFEKDLHWFAPYYFKGKSGITYEQLGSDSYDYFTKDWYHLPKVLKAPVWTDPYFDEGGGGIIMTTYARPFFERGADGAAPKVKRDRHSGCFPRMAHQTGQFRTGGPHRILFHHL